MDPGIDTIKRYQRYFKKLIELERQEEISFHLNEIRSITGPEREKKGRALLGLKARDQGRGLGGIYLVKVSKNKPLPDTEVGVGDLVILSSGHPDGQEAQAVVTEKTGFYVTVAYNIPPPSYIYKKNIRLDLFANDVTFQRMQEALFSLKENQAISRLLLNRMVPARKPGVPDIRFIQTQLNQHQQNGVSESMRAEQLFLIHGPPGTGKTTTLVEAILQHVRKGNKVLATADSNTAVDNMVEKLIALKCSVIRMGNPARLNEKIASVSLDQLVQDDPDYQQAVALRDAVQEIKDEQNKYIQPAGQARRGLSDDQILKLSRKGATSRGIPQSKIHKMADWINMQRQVNVLISEAKKMETNAVNRIIQHADVVCATNSSAGSELLSDYTFDVSVIDEATQSMEPSCLIPMVKASKWILAGDHKQLPPTVLSDKARALNETLFERWINAFEEDHAALLKLQYRMNEKIMQFPNREFYEGKLTASPRVKHHHLGELSGFIIPDDLPEDMRQIIDPMKPVCFVNIPGGKEKQITGSFSWFNTKEAEIVSSITRMLMSCRLFPDDIGIISPYEQQVNNLKSLLAGSGIEIKTVDGFQGREKEIIIISMVRANTAGNLGFLTDYRRLNVALTRARKKLIITGHADTLKTNRIYDRMLQNIDHHITIE